MTAVNQNAAVTTGQIGILRSTDFTLNSDVSGDLFVATASLTVTLPAGGVLGNGFECVVVNDSGSTVTIDGPGVTNITLADDEVATIYETNYKQRVVVESSTVVGDRFTADTPWDPTVFGTIDLVHWWDASTGITLDPTSGLVNVWADMITGVPAHQSDVRRQPTWQNSDEVRLEGKGIALNVPSQGRASYESKFWLMLFRVNWTLMASSTDQFFFDINGTSNTNGQKQPQFRYLHATHQIQTLWYANDGLVSVTVDVPGADDTWHSLVCRRTDDHIYASIDGAAEVSLACYPRAFLDTGSQPIGFIGNGQVSLTGTIVTSIGIDTLVWGQREISTDEIARAHAWMLWKRGAEASLDGSSPYLLAAPLMSLADQHVADPDSYADGFRFPNTGWDDTPRGTALDLTGYTRTFHDHFTSLSTITDGLTGAGPWFAPAHIDTSGARFRLPSQIPLDTYTILPDNTTLQIKIQLLNAINPLKPVYASGHIQSVDTWRNGGFTQAVPTGGASYFEARMAMNAIGIDSFTGDPVEPAPAWNAFWLYSPLDAKDSAATKAEVDVVECYGDRDPSINEIHIAGHRHAAYRPQPGNAGSSPGTISHTPSKIVDVTQSPWNVSPSLFDGQGDGQPGTFHTYGVMIDATWITWYFDGLVVSRAKTYREALGELYMLVSLQSQDLDPLGIPGQGGGTPNCTSYLWVDYVDVWSHA